MRIDGELRIYPAEDFARLLRRCVMLDDRLPMVVGHLHRPLQKCLWRDDFMDEQVCALGVLH